MAEPLKDSFGPEVPRMLAEWIARVDPSFDSDSFLEAALEGYEELELTPRGWHIARSLRPYLPDKVPEALRLIIQALPPDTPGDRLEGMAAFTYLPFVFFVAEYGADHFEPSMEAQHELTRRFTAEFSIRVFLERYPERTLERLRKWAGDPNHHVRRLVSEGTRPRLPWAARLPRFQADPGPVIALLALLRDDPELYVRRSVANNLNDIAKDHPERVVALCREWMEGADDNRRWLVRHGLRTLVKAGNAGALEVLGFRRGCPVEVETRIRPSTLPIGGKVQVEVAVRNRAEGAESVAVDLRIHFVKWNGGTSPKVFKGAELVLAPGEERSFRRSISVAQHTTRTHHPGVHRVELLVNGETRRAGEFQLVDG